MPSLKQFVRPKLMRPTFSFTAFTRLITSLYLVVFLSIQTHVQLALLGRSSYIASLISSLPPRTPSPPASQPLPLPSPLATFLRSSSPPSIEAEDDEDLERTLYEAKKLPPTREEREAANEEERKDTERKYLTFSWWVLHEGWKAVEERVRAKVEEVVTPFVFVSPSLPLTIADTDLLARLGLKTPIVYGELGSLFGQIRRKVEVDEQTGKPFE
jgi:peroxin-3